jgi:DNA polymerase III epsilon subunit-like protein
MPHNIYRGIDRKTDFREKPLIFIDLETSGMDLCQHEIIEIACLVVDPKTLRIKKRFERKIMPKHLEKAAPESLKVTGFSEKVWQKEAQPLKKVLRELNQLAPKGMFAGWNISFDRPFLEKAIREKKMMLNFDYHWLDISMLAYQYSFPGKKLKQLKLTDACEVLGIPRGKKHTAMADIEATLAVYKALVKR